MAATATKARKRITSEIGNDLAGFVTMANAEKLANELATKLGITAIKAKTTVAGMVRRLNSGNGILPSRSKKNMDLILDEIARLRGPIAPMVEELRKKISYKSGKTGKRDNSWIRDLMAGVPRLHNDGNYYAYTQVTKEQAQAICDEMDVDLPTAVETQG